MKIISITGTKGKTTVTRAIASVLHGMGEPTLRVDTDGHYFNEKQKSTLDDSKKLYGTVPTVAPGKYLYELKKTYPKGVAVLEAALGSSAAPGLGYGLHDVGIFLNVLEDHLGVTKRLKKRSDLAKAKRFIFSRIADGGYAIFNADDKYVCNELKSIPDERKITLLPVGISFRFFDIKKHERNGGSYITFENGNVLIRSKNKATKVVEAKKIPWTFDGQYVPSIYNLMHIVAGLYAYGNMGELSEKMKIGLENYRLDSTGGRLTLLQGKDGIKIIVDYAHEKYSLIEMARLAEKMSSDGKNGTLGVVRLAPDRTDKMISETGMAIANRFANIIVYDKLDGISRGRYVGKKQKIVREVGEVSQILFDSIAERKKGGFLERIVPEYDAIRKAAEIAKANSVVIVICGDDHKKTIESIKKYFKAKLV